MESGKRGPAAAGSEARRNEGRGPPTVDSLQYKTKTCSLMKVTCGETQGWQDKSQTSKSSRNPHRGKRAGVPGLVPKSKLSPGLVLRLWGRLWGRNRWYHKSEFMCTSTANVKKTRLKPPFPAFLRFACLGKCIVLSE
eukprot:833652-Rhodomonas_salina.1